MSTRTLLLQLALPLALFSMAMVMAMVRFSLAVLDKEASPARRKTWGATYLLLWVGIVATFVHSLMTADPVRGARQAPFVLLAPIGWFALHGLLLWFGLALQRSNERSEALRAQAAEYDAAEDAGEEVDEEEPQPDAAATSTPGWAARFSSMAWMAFAIAIVIAGNQWAALRSARAALAPYRSVIVVASIAVIAAGFLIFMGGVIFMALSGGRAMSHAEIEDLASQNAGRPGYIGRSRIYGKAVGSTASAEMSFSHLKKAWQNGRWKDDPMTETAVIMGSGTMLLFLGAAGCITAAAPPGVALLFLLVFAYAVVRTIRGFRAA
jgi:hypothetical protein